MPLTAAPANARPRAPSRIVPWLWPLGLLLVALAIGSGILVEGRLQETGMPGAGSGATLPERVLPYLFAFCFPLGMALLALGAQSCAQSGAPRSPWQGRVALALALLAVAAPILVPTLAGRGLSGGYFGTGGLAIAACAALSFRLLGRIRRLLPAPLTRAADLATGALLCFAIAAWNLCGSAAMPSFLLEPERVLALGTLPFAIGQMKTVMALLVAGWLLILLAAASTLTALRRP